MKRSSSTTRRGEAGEGKVIPALIIIGLVGFFYGLWVYGPLYFDRMEVGSKCQEALNETWLASDVEVTRIKYLGHLRRLGTEEIDVDGVMEQVQIHDPDEEDLIIEIDELADPPVLSIDYSWSRWVILPLLGDEKEFLFNVYCEVTTAAPTY